MSGYFGPSLADFAPVAYTLELLSAYGWYVVGAAVLVTWLASLIQPHAQRWRQAREDAEYHKDPDVVLGRMEAVQRARERQQQLLLEESARAAERQREREERKRQEVLRLLSGGAGGEGAGAGANRLGSSNDYMPLSGGASTSNYRAPKKSKCGGGGCGK